MIFQSSVKWREIYRFIAMFKLINTRQMIKTANMINSFNVFT